MATTFAIWWLFIGGWSTMQMVPVPYASAAACEAAYQQIVGAQLSHACVPSDRSSTPEVLEQTCRILHFEPQDGSCYKKRADLVLVTPPQP